MPPKTNTKRRQQKAPAPLPTILDLRIMLARRLDRLADAELRYGHHQTAELLSWRAAAIREGGRA